MVDTSSASSKKNQLVVDVPMMKITEDAYVVHGSSTYGKRAYLDR
jgi:hypothetical protein